MNQESGVIHIYRTALCIAIGLTRMFEHECSLTSLMVFVVMGLTLIVMMI